MAIERETVYVRAGRAHELGAPVGASVDLARSTSSVAEVEALAPSFAAGASFVQPGNRITPQGTVEPEKPLSVWDRIGGVASQAGKRLLRALEWGTEATGNLAEASLRTAYARGSDGRVDTSDLTAFLAVNPAWAWTQADWRENWDKAVEANASVFQTAWLIAEEGLDKQFGIAGTSGSGIEDPMTGEIVGPRVRSGGLSLLDDPERYAERQEYFSEGAAHWTTGIGDALWQIFADPLVVVGKGGAVVRAARSTLSADDVARVADRTVDTADLTSKQRRARNLATRLAEAFEEGGPGAVTAASRSKFLRNTTDGGAIAYLLERAGAHYDDAAQRIAAREDVIFAGMGDAAALARLEKHSLKLSVELRKIQAGVDDVIGADDLLARTDLDDADAVAQAHARLNDTPLRQQERKALEPVIKRELDALDRVMDLGRPVRGDGAPAAQVGELSRITGSRDVAKVAKTIRNGPVLERVHFVKGMHLPGTFRLAADDAPQVFHSAVLRARSLLKKNDPRYAEFSTRLAQIEDEFVAAGTGASTKAPRGRVMNQFNRVVDEIIAHKHGIEDVDGLRAAFNKARVRRMEDLVQIGSRIYKARQAGERPLVTLEDGIYAFHDDLDIPVMRSQIQDWVSILDPRILNRFARDKFKGGLKGYVTRGADGVVRVTDAVLGPLNRIWKFGALLRPFAYFVRAQVDTQARMMAMLGVMKYATLAARGVGNGIHNFRRIDRAEAAAFTQRFYAHQEIDRLQRELAEAGVESAWVTKDLPETLREKAERLRTLQDEVSKPVQFAPEGKKVRIRHTDLARHVGQSAKINRKTGEVTRSRIQDAYLDAREFKSVADLIDAGDSISGLVVGATRGEIDHLRGTGEWNMLPGTHSQWVESYLRLVNHQIRHDQLAQRILRGESDAELFAWFRNDPEGRKYLRDMMGAGGTSPEAIVVRAREHIDTLLPDGSLARSQVLDRNLKADDIEPTFGPAATDRPEIPGEMLVSTGDGDTSIGRTLAPLFRGYEKAERFYFDWVASVPEHMMGRHPFYAARFEQHANDALRRAGVADESALTLAQINDIRRKAAQKARTDVARYLFDTSRQSTIGHVMRFVSPFYGAWADTMTKWGRIFGANPAAAPVFWDAVRAPNAGGLVVDQDGNRIDPAGNVIGENGEKVGEAAVWDGYIIVPIPDWGPGGWLQSRTGSDKLRISKNAMNVVFQGDPWWLPGPGPVVAIPTNELLTKHFPEWWPNEGEKPNFGQQILQYLLPLGTTSDSPLEQAMPSWARAARQFIAQDGARFDQMFAQLYQEQVNAERNGQAEVLSDEQRIDLVANRARNWALLRLIGTQMPFSFSPQSRLSHYKDEYNRYRRLYGWEADDKFAADYPEFFDMAISLSANETGLQATDESWGAIGKYRTEMAKHPEYGWFWAGAANMVPGFNDAVYDAQMSQRIGPGTSTKFRSRKDPLEAVREANIEVGWREYQQVMTAIGVRLQDLGISSLQSKEAEPLRELRRQFVLDLSRRNPDWAGAYGDTGNARGRVTEFLSMAAEQLDRHPELAQRGDGVALTKYLLVRQAMQAALMERAAAGGSRSINAESNADLHAIWADFTGQLVAEDIGFEQIWNRALGERESNDGSIEFVDDLTGDLYARSG